MPSLGPEPGHRQPDQTIGLDLRERGSGPNGYRGQLAQAGQVMTPARVQVETGVVEQQERRAACSAATMGQVDRAGDRDGGLAEVHDAVAVARGQAAVSECLEDTDVEEGWGRHV